jgi:hypothetical protein
MLEIIVDCNSDMITITDDMCKPPLVKVYAGVKQPNMILEMLDTVFAGMSNGMVNEHQDIKLTRIDEDISTTVGEW